MLVMNNTPFVHARGYLQYLNIALPERTWKAESALLCQTINKVQKVEVGTLKKLLKILLLITNIEFY